MFNKVFTSKILKVLIVVSVFCFLIFSPSFIFNKSNYQTDLSNILSLSNIRKSVLDLWHIETFEGGSLSRAKYLEKQAIKFNKQNQNCYITIKSMTPEQLSQNLLAGNQPSLFSFGVGVGDEIKNLLLPLQDDCCVRKDLITYGKYNKSILSYPIILSGYCLISYEGLVEDKVLSNSYFSNKVEGKKEIKAIGFCSSSSNNSAKALLLQNISITKQSFFDCSSSYNAYTNFLNKNFSSLLGTARDVARCKNRESLGSMSACRYTFLSGYSDLVQYIGVNKNLKETKLDFAKRFALFLASDSAQMDLKNYGLFTTTGTKIYDGDYMAEFENCLNENLLSTNVFTSLTDLINNSKRDADKLFSA